MDHQVLHSDQQLGNIECYHLYHGLAFTNNTSNVKFSISRLYVVRHVNLFKCSNQSFSDTWRFHFCNERIGVEVARH